MMFEVLTFKGFIILLTLILTAGVAISHTKYWEGTPLLKRKDKK